MIRQPVRRLRFIALVEGISFLVLLGIAMPLKYVWNTPMAVKITGWIHGVLFMLFCLALLEVMIVRRWHVFKAAKVFVAALLPFGPFVMDRSLRAEQEPS